eukprot:TRINITY_DN5527_c1_g3_i2.p1 TRINITY_DN5527_c1_g3~~TRINITY_DN5527_c1_g3_i2.p1  ORF type:complete len:185 (-),score=-9.37 TRINITY_DN5527_c1_g3_i2:257-811(-)
MQAPLGSLIHKYNSTNIFQQKNLGKIYEDFVLLQYLYGFKLLNYQCSIFFNQHIKSLQNSIVCIVGSQQAQKLSAFFFQVLLQLAFKLICFGNRYSNRFVFQKQIQEQQMLYRQTIKTSKNLVGRNNQFTCFYLQNLGCLNQLLNSLCSLNLINVIYLTCCFLHSEEFDFYIRWVVVNDVIVFN